MWSFLEGLNSLWLCQVWFSVNGVGSAVSVIVSLFHRGNICFRLLLNVLMASTMFILVHSSQECNIHLNVWFVAYSALRKKIPLFVWCMKKKSRMHFGQIITSQYDICTRQSVFNCVRTYNWFCSHIYPDNNRLPPFPSFIIVASVSDMFFYYYSLSVIFVMSLKSTIKIKKRPWKHFSLLKR